MTYSEITKYLFNLFRSDKLVNTISFSDNEIIDTKKENIYPLVSISLNDSEINDDLKLYSFTISVLQQRDARKEVKPSKLMDDENYIDNINECDSICTNFINYIRRIELSNINIESISSLQTLSEYGGANLDGFKFDITISLPNTGSCFPNAYVTPDQIFEFPKFVPESRTINGYPLTDDIVLNADDISYDGTENRPVTQEDIDNWNAGGGGSMTAEEIRDTLGPASATNDGYLLSSDWSEFKTALTIDTVPTDGSTNPVQSDGVFDALALKVDKIAGKGLTVTPSVSAISGDMTVNSSTTHLIIDTALAANAIVTLFASSEPDRRVVLSDRDQVLGTLQITVKPPSGARLNGVIDGDYVIKDTGASVIFYSSSSGSWWTDQGNAKKSFLLNGFTGIVPAKTSVANADSLIIEDSADSNKTKKITWANVKTTLDSFYVSTTYLLNSLIGLLPSKATNLVDNDLIVIGDSEDANKTKKRTFAQFKANLKSYFDTIYPAKIAPSKQTYSGTITWTGTTAPSGTTNHTYNWIQIGNLVTLQMSLVYATGSSSTTSVTIAFPSDCPAPIKPDGLTGASNRLYVGVGYMGGSLTSTSTIADSCFLRSNAANTGFEVILTQAGGNHIAVNVLIQYFTS